MAVFVHFIGPDDQIFQDDHVFLEDRVHDIQFQPYPEVFMESRRVEVPESLPPGQYICRMGLYDRLSGERLKPRGTLPVKSRSMELPFVVSVTE